MEEEDAGIAIKDEDSSITEGTKLKNRRKGKEKTEISEIDSFSSNNQLWINLYQRINDIWAGWNWVCKVTQYLPTSTTTKLIFLPQN